MENETVELKNKLLQSCKAAQSKNVDTAKTAMLDAQESANDEKSSMGDKFESFREQMQIDRDMYADRYDKAMKVMATLDNIVVETDYTIPNAGAIVLTDRQAFFVSASLGQLIVDEGTYMAISTGSPIFQAMAGKKVGDKFQFRDTEYIIRSIK
ncbi:MAG: hypothetical protein SGJ04_00575 [Bacteroidota bacterium]|nr:hypothetical protein [Bacteroidota bacterium]